MAKGQGLVIYQTLKADLDRITKEDCNKVAQLLGERLRANIQSSCNKGYSTGNMLANAYSRYQGSYGANDITNGLGYIVYGIRSGAPYAKFVNDGTNPTTKYMRYFDPVLNKEVVLYHRKAVKGKHFMEKTYKDVFG